MRTSASTGIATTYLEGLEELAGKGQIVIQSPFIVVGDRKGGYLAILELKFHDPAMWGYHVHLAFIGVEPDARRHGSGTKVMEYLTQAADKLGYIMHLEVSPQPMAADTRPPMTAPQLKKWYEKFGFRSEKDRKWEMVRQPLERMSFSGGPKIKILSDNPSEPSVFWGKAGAGILFHCTKHDTYLLTLRSMEVEQGGTWSIPGGACGDGGFFHDSDGRAIPTDEAFDCAKRETIEELSWFPVRYEVVDKIVYQKSNFVYTTFIVDVPEVEMDDANRAVELNWENDDFKWLTRKQMRKLGEDLHFGIRYALDFLK